ncbi:hypothetical protein XELAEV_18037466mg [Xenopus laevis]|uniref:Uncharacterized protein n=1 Tax=Xenopus laevis TaxID=8355 RepID=A0A974CC35_XENLA|nr:hypothetical protein XELAEV_18037466mg [Xenopus laevis]
MKLFHSILLDQTSSPAFLNIYSIEKCSRSCKDDHIYFFAWDHSQERHRDGDEHTAMVLYYSAGILTCHCKDPNKGILSTQFK